MFATFTGNEDADTPPYPNLFSDEGINICGNQKLGAGLLICGLDAAGEAGGGGQNRLARCRPPRKARFSGPMMGSPLHPATGDASGPRYTPKGRP